MAMRSPHHDTDASQHIPETTVNVLHHWICNALYFGRRRCARATMFLLLFVACAAAFHARDATAATSDPIVLDWNEIAVEAVGSTPPFPSTRAMATVQVAVFEAVNAITQRYQPYLGAGIAASGASEEAAAVVAAHDTLLWLFPAQQSFLDERRDTSLAAIAGGRAKDQGIAVGQAAAAVLIANRTNDGAQAPMFYTSTSTPPYGPRNVRGRNWSSTAAGTCSRAPTCAQRGTGRSTATRTSWRPAFRASLRAATCGSAR